MATQGTLQKYSVEELQAEIERRANAKPERLQDTGWRKVSIYIEKAIDQVDLDGKLPTDFEHHLMITVLEAMYGATIWEWWNRKLHGK